MRAVLLAVAAFWLFGAVLFLRADGSVDYTLPRRSTPPTGEHNLASYRYGPRVRASSYYRDTDGHHHPLFLVDQRPMPSVMEKWACNEHDRHPWVAITWREPRTLARVRIQHAGLRERASFTARSYHLRCLTADGVANQLVVRGNRDAIAEHPLACQGALGVRIDFSRKEGSQIVRVFEVEAWGR